MTERIVTPMESNLSVEKLLFSDPRLEFSASLRFLWGLVTYSFYSIFTIGTILAVISDIEWLRWFGILCTFVLIDRALHINTPLHMITSLKPEGVAGVNITEFLLPKTFRSIIRALDKTGIAGGNFYLHLMKTLIRDAGIRGALYRLEISPEEFEHKIDEEIEKFKSNNPYAHEELLSRIHMLVKTAFLDAYANGDKYIAPNDIFAALRTVDDAAVRRVFYLFSLDANDLQKALIFSRYRQKFSWMKLIPETIGGFAHKGPRHRVMNRAWTARPTPTLDMYSDDLTDLAREQRVGFLVGHQQEYGTIVNILSRGAKQNVMLIGEPGSGKEAIISHLAHNIVKDKVPDALFDKRLVSLSIGELVSGAGPEEISERVRVVTNELIGAKNIILYIPDIHNLFKTAGEGFMNVATLMLPAIAGDAFQVIGSTYPREMKVEIETHSDFLSVFETVRVEEISEDDAIRLLTYAVIILEKQYNIVVSFEAIKASVSIAHKYFKQKLLPSSAEDLLKEALADATQRGEKMLTDELVIAVAERKVNIPIHKTTKEEADKLLNLEDIIHINMVDQEQAVSAVARALRQYRSGLARSSGPIATFLFVGPTGVGKTELAKILATTQFGSEQMLLRFDMSEYQDKQSIFRFIGTPDGKMSGTLTESVIQKPYSLILLDEFEKAHPDVLNLFLQVLDDGRITDNVGRVVDFHNTIVIATSNANSEFIKDAIESGRSIEDIKDEFKKKLTAHFRPELLNRFSDVILFKNLSVDDTIAIARMQIKKLAKTLGEDQGINLVIDDAVVQHLARIGHDPVFGARPLRTVINDRIKSQLAEMILRREITQGSHLQLSMEGDDVRFVIKEEE
ncbi:MAG: ATPase AAA-2 domain protein [Candidatus Wolfebacteria bacterium GW2011_GWC2_39_22]|uniref:ATPase AAA-2 domain protein n=1 Tax=Candidatus Wolfebacteria bacterium GW2011_GWC2_39_22 TaxID=1619013 RepID=A0A0G0QQ78_9BACT|nr:MAG: ATPase AAA-2 domain protein [Candidatus Wolfebacteria bacterium GW2011_GWC2_39_22]HBI25756.1 hypothetical protein [Candidatus Wolfebacteria bacterium]